jgi:hypothetical protein
MSEKKELPVQVVEQPTLEIEIDKKALIKAAKAAEEKEIAKVRQQFNSRTMKIKTRLLAEAGVEIEKWGAKKVGHGRLHCAGDNADRAIAAIQEDIDRLSKDPNVNPLVLAELRAYQWRFNKQIIEVGQLHLDAAKEVAGKASSDMRISFPAGQPVMVAVSPPQQSVNDKEKALTDGKPAA